MEDESMNPWAVGNLEEFLYFCCPECDEKNKSEDLFLKHAFKNHPKSKACLLSFTTLEETFQTDNFDHEVPIKNESLSDEEIEQVDDSEHDITSDVKPVLLTTVKQEDEIDVLKSDKTHGTTNKRFRCDVCHKAFTTNGYLKKHLKNFHDFG